MHTPTDSDVQQIAFGLFAESAMASTMEQQLDLLRKSEAESNLRWMAGRMPVTVAEYASVPGYMDNDVPAYKYDAEARELGLECWRLIDGIDAHIGGGMFDIWFANGNKPKTVNGGYVIYVAQKHHHSEQGTHNAHSS